MGRKNGRNGTYNNKRIGGTAKYSSFHLKSGLIRTPATKEDRKSTRIAISSRMERFPKELASYTKRVNERLGYDINKDYGTEPRTQVKDIRLTTQKQPQTFAIPIKQELAYQFMTAPKYIIKTYSSRINGEKKVHHKKQHLCVSFVNGQIVVFDYNIHYKHPYNKYSREDFNLSLSVLLKGTQYVHLDRYDRLSNGDHIQVFENKDRKAQKTRMKLTEADRVKNMRENVVMQLVESSAYDKYGHRHPYDIRYSVFFNGKHHVGHEDRVIAPKYDSIEAARVDFEEMYNIRTLNLEILDDLSLEQIQKEINEFEKNEKAVKLKKEKARKKENAENGKYDQSILESNWS